MAETPREQTRADTGPEARDRAEAALIAHLRLLAAAARPDSAPVKEGWAYPSVYHLLLDAGRFFTPAPLPQTVVRGPERECFANAAALVREHGMPSGLTYCEGYASTPIAGTDGFPTMHAWASTTQGAVVDPTWPRPGTAYLGIPITNPTAWPPPRFGTGILQDPANLLTILRDGVATTSLPNRGRRTDS
ncbi:hypothetical protein ACFWUW_27575 [Streptomyces sp. NPDC058655]|uniref:hypothetical protein n=1 Tax=Streptomyces sp. NPDC058655 TaxID=3346577 RepID=UPI003661DBB1